MRENVSYHLIKPNDKISKIMAFYQVTKGELISLNPQIRDWDNLLPGMRINLPKITESDNVEIDLIEPFIEDYYPKYTFNKQNEKVDLPEVDQKKTPEVILVEKTIEQSVIDEVSKVEKIPEESHELNSCANEIVEKDIPVNNIRHQNNTVIIYYNPVDVSRPFRKKRGIFH